MAQQQMAMISDFRFLVYGIYIAPIFIIQFLPPMAWVIIRQMFIIVLRKNID
jgi:hypothetical protein